MSALTGGLIGGLETENPLHPPQPAAVDLSPDLWVRPQTLLLTHVPQAGRPVPTAGHYIPPPIHDGCVIDSWNEEFFVNQQGGDSV